MNKKIYYVWLSKLGLPNKIKLYAINKLGGVEAFYNSSLDDLIYINLKDKYIAKVLDISIKESSKIDLEYMNKNNIDIISIEEKDYPSKLKNINDFPICFYLIGNKNILNDKACAIVGSRFAKKESLDITKEISKFLSSKGINIVSGLARGVDKYAHLGCLNANISKTIAVLGSGIDKESVYPFENMKVYERIIENGGAVISEYPLKTKPLSYNFPYRNRIISGLSDSIIVVQASKKSGSLITVDYALEQGKDVYVYNSKNINEEYFLGNKLLLEQGAKKIF